MHYTDHALLSAHKFNCNPEDTLELHELIDSSKYFFPSFQHRLFSHNNWVVYLITRLYGDTVKNTKTGGVLSVRDILWEHLKEDHNGHSPSIQDWLNNIEFKIKPEHSRWFNNPRKSDKELLKKIKDENTIN